MKSSLFPSLQSPTGFSLIEILISILLLSVGMLGAIKLQLHSMQTTQQANFNSTAIELATEIAEKMRNSRETDWLDIDFQSGKKTIDFSYNCFIFGCSPEQLTQAQLSEWIEQVDAALPNARVVICRDNVPRLNWECTADNDNPVVIKLGWADQQETEDIPPPRIALAVTPY